MNRVLILGGNGYIGGALASSLMASGYHVTVVSRSSITNIECHRYIQLDLTKNDACKSLIVDEVDTVIDLVSYIPPNTENVSVSDIKRTLESYENLLKHINDKQYLFFSSGGTVYGNSSMPLSESAPLKPVSPYGVQKCIQEELIQKLMPKGVIMRVTNPYGGIQRVKHGVGFVAHLLDCYLNKRTLTLTVPKNTVRDYIHIDDLIYATKGVLDLNSDVVEIFNISTSHGTSLEELIESLQEPSRLALAVNDVAPHNHILCNILDNSKLENAIKFKIRSRVTHFVNHFSHSDSKK